MGKNVELVQARYGPIVAEGLNFCKLCLVVSFPAILSLGSFGLITIIMSTCTGDFNEELLVLLAVLDTRLA